LIKNNKLVNDLQKVKQLTSFTVVNDVVNNPKWNFSIIHNTSLNDILSGAKSIKKYKISYEN
jgi:glycerol-3-phosphate cytidylyltransferase-like family protein